MNNEMNRAFMAKKKSWLVLLLAMTCWTAQAALPGSTCKSAIPLTKDFSDTIRTQPIDKWYSAMTFDLPLAVAFVPDDGESAPAPEVEMDFSCTSGYYEDSILCSLFCKTSGSSGIDMKLPYKQQLTKGKKDGKFAYTLSLGKRYRDLLLQMGISSNLKVVVKVKYRCTGVLTMLPDAFTDCMEGAKFIRYGDTVMVAADDKQRHVIVPYVQWQEDTVVYSWSGTKPCKISVAYKCDFDPMDNGTEGLVQFSDVEPGSSKKIKAESIYSWVHNEDFPPQAGMYFAKFYSLEPGVMTITKAKQAVPEGNATMLRFGMTYPLNANSKELFAIPRSWNVNVKFSTPTNHLFSMEIATSSDFSDKKTYTFKPGENGRWVGIFKDDLIAMWNKIPQSKHYLYIRFICSEATTIVPERWDISQCYENTKDRTIVPGQTLTMASKTTSSYRFSYPQWVGGDMQISFALNADCEVYIADTCGMSIKKNEAPYWLKYMAITRSTMPLTIPAEEIATWADRIDGEGCFYAIFKTDANSTNRKLTFTTNAPEEKDPVYPASTIAVACDEDNHPYVQVSEAQHISVKDANGDEKKAIDAVPDAKYSLTDLPAGKYTLEGETEKITINL